MASTCFARVANTNKKKKHQKRNKKEKKEFTK